MLRSMLFEEIAKRRLSNREAAAQIGVAHTTVQRVLEGHTVNVDTVIKMANWLGVSPSSLIDADGMEESALAAQIATALEREPELAKVFGEAMDRVIKGDMSPELFRELASYIGYRLGIEGKSG